jgi:hypothetical protein
MRYRLRTLLIVLAVAPVMIAGAWTLAQSEPQAAILAAALFSISTLSLWVGAIES